MALLESIVCDADEGKREGGEFVDQCVDVKERLLSATVHPEN